MRPTISNPYRYSGFTLVELIVTLAVFTILALVAVPSFTDYIARSRLRAAADAVTNQLALARAEAMRRHRDVVVSVNTASGLWCTGGKQYVLVDETTEGISLAAGTLTACDCTTTVGQAACLIDGNTSLVSSTDYNTVELVSTSGSTSYQFDRNVGVINNLTGGTILLRSLTRPTRYELNIIVGPLGHSRVCVPTGYASFGGYKTCS